MRSAFILVLITISSMAMAQRSDRVRGGGDSDLLDRLLRCHEEKNQLDRQKTAEIQNLSTQLYLCQSEQQQETVWSCQAGCTGLGNVGFGTGKTEAEARAAAKQDLGFTCSEHTFDCHRE